MIGVHYLGFVVAGIYLPLECDAADCHHTPLIFTYDAAHFSALVTSESEAPIFTGLQRESLYLVPYLFCLSEINCLFVCFSKAPFLWWIPTCICCRFTSSLTQGQISSGRNRVSKLKRQFLETHVHE